MQILLGLVLHRVVSGGTQHTHAVYTHGMFIRIGQVFVCYMRCGRQHILTKIEEKFHFHASMDFFSVESVLSFSKLF